MNEILKVLEQFRSQGYTDEQIETAIKKLVQNQKITEEQGKVIIQILRTSKNGGNSKKDSDEGEKEQYKPQRKPQKEKDDDEDEDDDDEDEEKKSHFRGNYPKRESKEEEKARIMKYFGE